MRYFVITDVHGFYDEMIEALDIAGFDPKNEEHWLISLGDVFDRNDKPMEVIRYLNDLPRKTLIRGNHEDLLEELIKKWRCVKSHDYHNGTVNTIETLTGKELTLSNFDDLMRELSMNAELTEYYSRLVDYEEIGDYIFVHAWVPTFRDEWRDSSTTEWQEARWWNPFKEWWHYGSPDNKTIVCGHWATAYGNARYHNKGTDWGEEACYEPFIDNGIIALDACTAYTKKCNVAVIDIED